MKAILNWRYYVIAILFAFGFLSVARVFGEPTHPMTNEQWLGQVIISLTVAAVSFFLFRFCVAYWERRDEIDEFSNLKNE